MTKMTVTLIYGKTFKYLLLHNQKSEDLETGQGNRLANRSQTALEHPWEGKNVSCINCLCHMTKMTVTLIYGKTFKYLLLQNKKSEDLDGISITRCINDDPVLTLT